MLADWWEDFALGSDDDRSALLDDAREAEKLQQRGRASGPKVHQLPRKESAASATATDASEEEGEGGEAEFSPAKKRRRRRKPKAAVAAAEPSAAAE